MDIFHLLYKPLIIFFVLFILVRITGKKSLSQITFYDYISGVTIGAIAGSASTDRKTSVWQGIAVLCIWVFLPKIMSYIEFKNLTFERKSVGEPLILIKKGILEYQSLKKSKYSIDDLLMQLRKKDVFDISEVEYALLEVDGQISILKKAPNNTVTPKDLNISPPYKGLPINLIISGRILESNLSLAEKDKTWLDEQLKQKNISNLEDVLYAYYTSNEEFKLFTKND